MSSPCSVPSWLRVLIHEETPAQQRCCAAHDAAYGRGGDEQARAIADARLLLGLLEAGMDWPLAEKYYNAVRLDGESHWGHKGPWRWTEPAVIPEAP